MRGLVGSEVAMDWVTVASDQPRYGPWPVRSQAKWPARMSTFIDAVDCCCTRRLVHPLVSQLWGNTPFLVANGFADLTSGSSRPEMNFLKSRPLFWPVLPSEVVSGTASVNATAIGHS